MSPKCAAIAGKSSISPKVHTTTVTSTPVAELTMARAPNPIANNRQPEISDHTFGQWAVAWLRGTSSATISRVLMVNSVP